MSTALDPVDVSNRERIESFFNTSSYRESLEVSATFNTKLSVERRQRLPFLDPQTGVAQSHCALYVKPKQRMPGLRAGQLYSYPGARWRKPKRQYLTNMMTGIESVISQQHQHQQYHQLNVSGSSFGGTAFAASGGGAGTMTGGFLLSHHDENSNSNASFLFEKTLGESGSLLDGVVDTNSRDTNNNSKDELSKDWLYDDLDNEFDSEPKSGDDEYDYDPRYGNKKRMKKAPKKEPKGKKTASAFGFDFGDSRSSGGSGKVRRSKDAATPKKGAGSVGGASEPGTERRSKRKGAGTKGGKKFIEPPSFETAAAGIEDQLSFGGAWM